MTSFDPADLPDPVFMTRLPPDKGEIRAFVNALFKHADAGTHVSLRAFHGDSEAWRPGWGNVKLTGSGLGELIDTATRLAGRCANTRKKVVFCPPIATFRTGRNARGVNLACGLVLTVECDEAAKAARERLERILGPLTIAVASGGEWTDPDTGEVSDKEHLHWRLDEPTRDAAAHGRLKEARRLAAEIVGGDGSAANPVHPLRWPGSWHRKGSPRLARIVSLNEAAEIDLTVALERLREAAAAEGINLDPNRTSSSDPQAEIIDVISALALIPNDDLPWHEWIRIGLAILRATGGSEEGREAFHKWSAKSGKYESATTDERWDHFARSPPDQIGAATLFFEARQADPDWIEPTLEAFIDEVFDIPDSALAIRSRIRIRAGELHSVTTKAEEALIAFDAPLFSRGANIVRPIVEDAEAAKGRRTKVARLIAVTSDGLVDHLSRAAVFERYDARSKKLVRIDPPRLIAATLLSRDGEWALRPLAGVITTPTLRPDGSLLAEEGYDPVTRLLLRGPPLMKPVKEAPTKDDAANALKLLKGLLSEFPFADQPSHSVGLSALISPIVRGALSVVPLHAASAPTAGSGKSYLFDLCATIAMGQRCPVIAAGRTEEETEKRLGAALLAGQSLISIDNLNGELGGDFLCQAVERPIVNVRILGKSELVPIESRTTIFANGNNMRVVGDMVRRTLRSLIDANQERPERRTFRSKPFETVLSDRGQYVAAALTIVRAYIVAGQPDPCPPLASFEDWSDLVRSALVWLGCADPAETIEASREDDPETSTLRQVVAAWKSVIGINEFRSAAELIVAANASLASFDEGDEKSSLHVAFQLVAKDGHELNPVKFGRWLSRYRGRVIDGLKLVSVEDLHAKIQRWALSPARDHL